MRASAPIACTALLLSACWSTPEVGRPRTAAQSLQRPLDPDFTTASFAARTRRLGSVFHRLIQEPGRAARAATAPGRALRSELARAEDLPATATGFVHREAYRTGSLHDDVGEVVHEVAAVEGDFDGHRTALARLLNVDDAPLGEISDRRHRTDPADERPEATLWQRILRRLRL